MARISDSTAVYRGETSIISHALSFCPINVVVVPNESVGRDLSIGAVKTVLGQSYRVAASFIWIFGRIFGFLYL